MSQSAWVKIEYEILDDATAAAGKWEPAGNLKRQAVADPSVVALIGHFNSGAAKLSIPVLNQADLVMVSPANTYPGLTKPGREANEPNVYYNGKRNYARVVPADDLQGLAANWAKSLGVKRFISWTIKSFTGLRISLRQLPNGLEYLDTKGLIRRRLTIEHMNKIKGLTQMIYFGITQRWWQLIRTCAMSG